MEFNNAFDKSKIHVMIYGLHGINTYLGVKDWRDNYFSIYKPEDLNAYYLSALKEYINTHNTYRTKFIEIVIKYRGQIKHILKQRNYNLYKGFDAIDLFFNQIPNGYFSENIKEDYTPFIIFWLKWMQSRNVKLRVI